MLQMGGKRLEHAHLLIQITPKPLVNPIANITSSPSSLLSNEMRPSGPQAPCSSCSSVQIPLPNGMTLGKPNLLPK